MNNHSSLQFYTGLLVSALLLSAIGRSGFAQQSGGYTDGVVAVVNDDVITVYDVAKFNADIEKQIHERFRGQTDSEGDPHTQLVQEINQNRIKAAHELINQKLIYAEFQKNGFQIPDEMVEKRVDGLVSSYAGGDWKKFEQILLESGSTLEEMRENFRKQLAVDLLMNQTVDRTIHVSPKEIEAYFNDHRDQLRPPKRIRLQLIDLGNADDGSVQSSSSVIYDALAGGTTFEALAKAHSTHSTRETGGDLGWMDEKDMRPEFKAGFMAIAAEAVSRPISVDTRLYILRIAETEGGEELTLDLLYDPIKGQLFNERKRERYEEYVSELRSKAYIRVFFKE